MNLNLSFVACHDDASADIAITSVIILVAQFYRAPFKLEIKPLINGSCSSSSVSLTFTLASVLLSHSYYTDAFRWVNDSVLVISIKRITVTLNTVRIWLVYLAEAMKSNTYIPYCCQIVPLANTFVIINSQAGLLK